MNENKKRKLPQGWRWEKLGDICFINPSRGKTFFREPTAQTSFVPMEAVDELTGRITKNIARSYSEVSNGYTFFEEGDVLFAKITPCMQNGKSAIARNLVDGIGFGSTEFHVLRPKPGVVKEWIYYFVRTREFRNGAEKNFEGSAGQKRVPVDFIESYLIPLPHAVNDQVTIANELEHKVLKIESMRGAALRQKDAISAIQGAILREVFPYKEGDKLPEGWKWVKLGGKNGVAEIKNGSTPSTDNPEYWNGDILWATPSDLGDLNSIYIDDTERKITKAGLDSCSTTLLPTGTVLLTSRAPVGNLAIARKSICTNQGFKSFVPKEANNSLYLYFALKRIVPEIQKQSHGNTFTEITKELVQNFEIPLPPTIDDQIAIANELERKMANIEKMREAIDRQMEAIGSLSGVVLREVFDFEN